MDGFGYDPVTAIAESDATGRVAEIFADIRATMDIPMLTSIWRGLVAVDGGLESVWRAAKPLYLTGQPAAALAHVVAHAVLPDPEKLTAKQFADADVTANDLDAARAIIDAYNRSNGMNLIALSVLVSEPSGAPADFAPVAPPAPWPDLRPLRERDAIDGETWDLIVRINQLGLGPEKGEVATLWRHLAHWPGLLSLIETGLTPPGRDGRLDQAIQSVHGHAQQAAAQVASRRQEPVDLPADARAMIAHYVATPYRVTRMVALGHGLSHWLADATP